MLLCINKSTILSCMEYYCHFWNDAPSCYLEMLDKLQKPIYKIIAPLFVATLEPLAYHRNGAILIVFYRYSFGRYSSELAQLVPLPYCQASPTRYSDRLGEFLSLLLSATISFLTQPSSGNLSIYRIFSFDL